MKNYKVLITTSGLGQRLGYLTTYTNKALVRIGKKPAISYIVESYPKNIELVVTLGYYGNQVKDFLELVYPERKIQYVEVDKYEGKGTSLGYSMLQAKNKLQCPFIYHASDTLVEEPIPKVSGENWVGGYRSSNSTNYASFNVVRNTLTRINDKGAINFDYLHIGLIGINDYISFWDELFRLYKKNPTSGTLNDSQTINSMIDKGASFRLHEFNSWMDTGNVDGLSKAREMIKDQFHNLDKKDESVFLFDESVIKFYFDKKRVKEKVKRATLLSPLVPKVFGQKGNFFKYQYSKGNLYSRVVTPVDFKNFLDWCNSNLWTRPARLKAQLFKSACKEFYKDKTLKRVQDFREQNSIADSPDTVNGESMPTLEEMLNSIDINWLSNGEPRRIHGDLILENIIKKKNGYSLLDWRENFGGLVEMGDVYYDLAKLNHNLTVNHDLVYDNMFIIENNNGAITCDIHRKQILVDSQEVLFEYIRKNGFDKKKVRVLTAIVWLNMSPLHHYPFNKFLYYFGKYNLWREINK
jgi:choline kinase